MAGLRMEVSGCVCRVLDTTLGWAARMGQALMLGMAPGGSWNMAEEEVWCCVRSTRRFSWRATVSFTDTCEQINPFSPGNSLWEEAISFAVSSIEAYFFLPAILLFNIKRVEEEEKLN